MSHFNWRSPMMHRSSLFIQLEQESYACIWLQNLAQEEKKYKNTLKAVCTINIHMALD